MFSSAELISFVFANENEIYFGDDLLKLNLNQYLWGKLHEKYKAVYFLGAEENTFSIRSFGDIACNAFNPSRSGLSKFLNVLTNNTEQQEQGGWILRQLCSCPSEAAALVCSLEDFCKVFSNDRWRPILRDIASTTKRSGIFVLTASATAERTMDLLLTSPVFDWICETAVTDSRGGTLQELFGPLQRRKWDNCVFLNAFTQERIRSLLLHIFMEYPERCRSCKELDIMADYLYAYMNDSQRQRSDSLLVNTLPIRYLMYRELYEQLLNESVWNRLEDLSERYARDTEQEKFQSANWHHGDPPVLRERQSYAGKCMMLQIPQWIYSHVQGSEVVERILSNIHNQVSRPKNRPENPQIVEVAEMFINRLDTVQVGDWNSYERILHAVEFCVDWIYSEPDGEEVENVLKLIDMLNNSVTVSEHCFALKRNLDIFRQHGSGGILEEQKLTQLQTQISIYEKTRDQYVDLVNASILQLTIPTASSSVLQSLSQLEQEVKASETQIRQQESVFDDDFAFLPEDYGFIPPSVQNIL